MNINKDDNAESNNNASSNSSNSSGNHNNSDKISNKRINNNLRKFRVLSSRTKNDKIRRLVIDKVVHSERLKSSLPKIGHQQRKRTQQQPKMINNQPVPIINLSNIIGYPVIWSRAQLCGQKLTCEENFVSQVYADILC